MRVEKSPLPESYYLFEEEEEKVVLFIEMVPEAADQTLKLFYTTDLHSYSVEIHFKSSFGCADGWLETDVS